MIQPIGALVPRAGFRGHDGACERKPKALNNSDVAIINAGGVAAAAGGIGTLLARRQTASWMQASFFGLCAATLTLFFITPSIISNLEGDKKSLKKEVVKKSKVPPFKEDFQIVMDVIKEYLRPAKKMIQNK